MTADLHFNESQRLEALHGYAVLDSPPERAFDRLTQLAARLFDVPMALVSLVDRDRQWFKSRFGLDARETPREFAFCAHAILQDEPLVVLDSTMDARFSDNPLVTGMPGIRFYAGVPIRTPGGHALGTLCVLDTAPRLNWAENENELLSELGAIVMDELQLRIESQHVIVLSQTLEHRANHDTLTGLPNRCLFESRLARAFQESKGTQGPAVLFIDLDRFKLINDNFGHHVGDKFLIQITERFRQCVGSRGFLARLGGDELTVLVQKVESRDKIMLLAQELLQSLEPAILVDTHQLFPAASIGISIAPEDGTDMVALMRTADIAMYSAKRTGPNQIQFANPIKSDWTIRLHRIQTFLYQALVERKYQLHYQPQYTLNGKMSGVEALIRLQHPDLGALSPAEFIPLAESNGLIIEIGDWVLSEACRQASQWRAQGIPIRVAVNVSPVQLKQPGFIGRLAEALQRASLPADFLELEITETAAMDDIGECKRTLLDIRSLGVQIAMDDFGIGYSSIRYLQHLPLQTLKIDRSFINELTSSNSPARELVRGVVGMAHAVGMKVVAEGVEHEEQCMILRNLHCDFAQGFFFSRPVSPEEITRLLVKDTEHWPAFTSFPSALRPSATTPSHPLPLKLSSSNSRRRKRSYRGGI